MRGGIETRDIQKKPKGSQQGWQSAEILPWESSAWPRTPLRQDDKEFRTEVYLKALTAAASSSFTSKTV
jgi:hypothetical protein